MRGVGIDVESAEQLLKELKGNVTQVAARLGVTRQALQRRIRRSARLRAALEEGRSALVSNAYEGLVEAVAARKAWAIVFVLKTLGKDEGFVERTEVVQADAHPQAFLDW